MEVMKKKAARKHLNKLWKKMQQHFKAFTHTADAEQLHQFRVQVKKIRSFLTLLETNKKNRQLLQTFKPVKKVFKSAGTIRDAFLHQQQAKKHNLHEQQFYKEQCQLQKQETENLLSEKSRQLQEIKKVRNKLRKRLHSMKQDEIKTFFKGGIHNTEHLLSKHNFSEQLHNGRKMLKHLMYNEHVLQNGLAHELKINFKYVDELQEMLGQWHDNKLALEFFVTRNLSDNDIASMRHKNEELQKTINNKTENFLQKIAD